jgi:asparagine synthase (glutamine-hydrolysing)
MSAIAAIIEWEGSRAGVDRSDDLESGLKAWRGDAIRVERAIGSVFGVSLLGADAVRQSDREPLVDRTREIALVADCRLDDRDALRAELALQPDARDADLLSAGYQRWGEELPHHLQGDFACVIWDWGRRRCFAFRDHLGVRPLFYCPTSGGLVLASDIELILALVRPKLIPDDRVVVEHLLWEYASTDRTFWSGIRRLPGGHGLVDGPGRSRRTWRYWTPDAAVNRLTGTAEVHAEFQRLFVQSVARRFQSTGPVLAHLSGGVDSSLIVCVADGLRRDHRPRPELVAVSQRFPGMSWDEGDFIRSVRDATQIEALDWDGSQAPFLDLVAPSLAGPGTRASRTSGSVGDLEIANQRSARVVLSGEGGDQLGAPWGLVDDLAVSRPGRFVLETLTRTDLSFRQKVARGGRLFRRLVPAPLRREVAGFRRRRGLPSWLSPAWRNLAAELRAGSFTPADGPPFRYEVQRAHWHQLTSGRLSTALDLQQVVAAKHGVEIRFPFLDRDLVEFVLSLPPECWPSRLIRARLQREAMASVLPPKIRMRTTKADFSGAGAELVKRSARQLDLLFRQGEWLSGAYVVRSEAKALLARALQTPDTKEPAWLQVRAIATLEAWLRAVFGYASAGYEGPSA